MDRLTATRVFVEVAERGSLTQAAAQLDMSAAMVSRYLAALESWLGTRLLHRTTRRVGLTEAGQDVLAQCRLLLEAADDVRHLAAKRNREPEGSLRIATSSSFAEAQLTSAIVAFQQQHARVRVELLVADRPVDLVADRIDLAVRITNSLDPAVVARPLARCRSVLCASPAYASAHGLPADIGELAAHRFVAHAFGAGTHYHFQRGDAVHRFDVSGTFSTNETTVLRRAVLDGAGLGMLPTYYVAPDLRRGELVRVLPGYEPASLGIHAVTLSRRNRPLALQLLLDFLAARFGGDSAPWDLGLV